MRAKIVSYAEMCFRPIIRPDLPLEWLTKVTLSEYNRWAQSEMECVSLAGMSMRLKLKNLENQRQAREKLYQMTKEQIAAGITTHDLVSAPSTRNAVLRADKYQPDPLHVVMDELKEVLDTKEQWKKHGLNGRSYPKNWMTGGYEYVPSKLSKRIMRDNGY